MRLAMRERLHARQNWIIAGCLLLATFAAVLQGLHFSASDRQQDAALDSLDALAPFGRSHRSDPTPGPVELPNRFWSEPQPNPMTMAYAYERLEGNIEDPSAYGGARAPTKGDPAETSNWKGEAPRTGSNARANLTSVPGLSSANSLSGASTAAVPFGVGRSRPEEIPASRWADAAGPKRTAASAGSSKSLTVLRGIAASADAKKGGEPRRAWSALSSAFDGTASRPGGENADAAAGIGRGVPLDLKDLAPNRDSSKKETSVPSPTSAQAVSNSSLSSQLLLTLGTAAVSGIVGALMQSLLKSDGGSPKMQDQDPTKPNYVQMADKTMTTPSEAAARNMAARSSTGMATPAP